MRKQTKLVAVLSAAALLALGASMTSFAAGWEKDDEGIWHYYDADGDMVEGEWKKDGGKWFYLDDEGDMLTSSWVDDEYYVGEDGAMVVNGWVYTVADEDQDDPAEDGEHWYYFGSKGKKVTTDKKINGKHYYFDEDGKMKSGWQQDNNGNVYYLGEENDGARTENQWLWLEKSGLINDDEDDDELTGMKVRGCDDTEADTCDDEGWYWFQSSGKMYYGSGKKNINGKYYIFNEHGQMLYEWIDKENTLTHASNAVLDGNIKATNADGTYKSASVSDMIYYNNVEDGSRANGWYEIDGSQDVGTDNDTNWYFFDDGVAEHATKTTTDQVPNITDETGASIYRARIKCDGKYFCFDQNGKMKTGLQYINAQRAFYSFDSNGYMQTGKVTSVECEDDDYTFYFEKKNGKNGQGVTGEKDGYLYFRGKRLEADDDNRLYYVNGEIYLVNTKGKIQKANTSGGKKFDIENKGIDAEDVVVVTNSDGKVQSIKVGNTSYNKAALYNAVKAVVPTANDYGNVMADQFVSVPFIALYNDNVKAIYTYTIHDVTAANLATTYGAEWRMKN